MTERERHVLGVDLIRFLAAAMVMGFHYDHAYPLSGLRFARAGWVGVEVFFVISGYVIAFSSEGAAAFGFAKARIARLAPAAWICGTMTAVALLIAGETSGLASAYLRTMTLWLTGPFVDDVYWTLPIEIIFYVFVFCTLGRRSLVSLPALVRVLAVASGAWWLVRAGMTAGGLAPLDGARFAAIPPILLSLVQFGCYFALGALLREWLRDGNSFGRAALMVVCVAAGAVQIAYAALKLSPGPATAWPVRPTDIVPIVVWAALVLAIGASVAWNHALWRVLGRWSGAIRVLGLATYPLYLLHARFGPLLGQALRLGPILTALAMVGLSVIVATLLEPPVRRLLKLAFSVVPERPGAPEPAVPRAPV